MPPRSDDVRYALQHEAIITRIMEMVQAPADTKEVFRTACMHGSWVNEHFPDDGTGQLKSNERLEFLGDSVLGLVIAETLYQRMPMRDEGELSKSKSRLVSSQTLIDHAKKMEIGDALLLGKGEESSGGRLRGSLLADALEAVIGAVFISSGFEKTREFIIRLWDLRIDEEVRGIHFRDCKTTLQEFVQEHMSVLPEYRLLESHGPDHDRYYEMGVFINDREYGRGKGKSKKAAEQLAAAEACEKFQILISETGEDS